MMRTIFGSYAQGEGPSQGLFWDAATMAPLFNSEAGEAALKVGGTCGQRWGRGGAAHQSRGEVW